MARPHSTDVPSTDLNPWIALGTGDPYPVYQQLRDLGPVVWFPTYGVYGVTRFDPVKDVLANWQEFSSGQGVGMDESANEKLRHNVLASDPPVHTDLRRELAAHLSKRGLQPDAADVERAAVKLVDGIVDRSHIDGVEDVARPYSLHVVCDLVGFPKEGREPLPRLAEHAFNLFGPSGPEIDEAKASLTKLGDHARRAVSEGLLAPDKRGVRMIEDGLDPRELVNFTWPGIDTTVNGISAALLLFSQHPDEWAKVRADRSLIPAAFNEALRMHSPVHFFTRVTGEDAVVHCGDDGGDIRLPAGERVALLYGCANRDERRYPEPDRFDVSRNPTDQLSFGRGIHLCVGIHLARLEGHAILNALADRVESFRPRGEPEWVDNRALHGLNRLPLELVPAG
jgi:cytochrome P450